MKTFNLLLTYFLTQLYPVAPPLSYKTRVNEYLTISKFLFTVFVALLNLTNLSLIEE